MKRDISGLAATLAGAATMLTLIAIYTPKTFVGYFAWFVVASIVGLIIGHRVSVKENKGESKDLGILNTLYRWEENLQENMFKED